MNYSSIDTYLHTQGLNKSEVESFQQIFFKINDLHISYEDAEWLGIKLIDMILPVLLFAYAEPEEPIENQP